MNSMKGQILFISFVIHLISGELCPDHKLVNPCICNETTKSISCENPPNGFDLQKHFTKLSANIKVKDFSVFRLEKSRITKLVPKFLSDIHFERLEFIDNTKLSWVSQDAFGGQTPFIKEIVLEKSPVTNDPITDLNLFDAINRLPSVVMLDLSGTQLIGIPDEAFISLLTWYSFKTKYLLFCKPTEKCRSIKSVGKKPFYYLNELKSIDLSRHLISFIDDFAFSQHNITNSGHKFNIILNDNELSENSFTENSFQFIGKETNLYLNDNKNLTFLRQQVFEPFLTDNLKNQLNVSGCPIDWNSPKMNWYKTLSPKLKERIHF